MPPGYRDNQLFDELTKATAHLGISAGRIITKNFPVREFPKHRQEILDQMIALRKEVNPDLVLLPNGGDVHQDHHVIHEEGIRAFKHSRLLGYELPWNSLSFQSNFHVKIDRSHLEAKMKALHEYKSQTHRPYMNEEFIFGLAKMRGIQINSNYAEAFELIRWFV